MSDTKSTESIQDVKDQLEEAGFDHGLAIATQAEVEAGAACGQLSIIAEEEEEKGSEE
ncbi:MAG: hypothetical protein ACFFD4_38990 [Candidatus Odinarchaeota archaeon]